MFSNSGIRLRSLVFRRLHTSRKSLRAENSREHAESRVRGSPNTSCGFRGHPVFNTQIHFLSGHVPILSGNEDP